MSPQVKARLQIVETQIERTSTIIQDLLVYARRPDPVRSVIDVNTCLQDCSALFQTEFLRQHVTCTVHLTSSPAPVSADRQQLQEVLNHLVENALQAMPEGGSLTMRASVSGIAGGEGEQRIAMEIADTGIGIDPEIWHRSFSRFSPRKLSGEEPDWVSPSYRRRFGHMADKSPWRANRAKARAFRSFFHS